MCIIQTVKMRLSVKQEAMGADLSTWQLIPLLNQSCFSILLAKWYLMKCTSIRKLVSINHKPLIKNSGIIHLGDEVRIWSNINKTKIFVNKGGELTVGRNSRINGVHISVSQQVRIGDNARSAPYTIRIENDFCKYVDH